MKVLNISLDKKLLTADSQVRQRVLGYARLFARFDLIVLSGRGYQARTEESMVIYPTNSGSRLFYLLDAYILGKKIIKKYQSDIISSQDPFETGLLAWLLARKYGLKFQVQIHGDYFGSPYWQAEKLSNKLRYYLGRFVISRADGLRVVSDRVKVSLIALGLAAGKIMVVPIYSELKVGGQDGEHGGVSDKFVFLAVGRLARVKNIKLQIEAMREVIKSQSGQNVELWIVGDGPEERKLKQKVKAYGLSASVKFLGWQDDLSQFYHQADAFLLISNYEGWGLAVIEAASYGLPIIMTDVGCAGEIIKNGQSGLVISVGDKRALAESMIKLLQDKELRTRLGRGAREAVLGLPSQEENWQLYKDSLVKSLSKI